MRPALTGWMIKVSVFLLMGVALCSSLRAGTAPSTYSAYTGTDTKPIPPAPALGLANSVINDPTFGSRILRVTDQGTQDGESFISTDAGFHRTWNASVAVVNSASFRPATGPIPAIAPGSIVSIFGTGFAGATQAAVSAPVPTVLLNTVVSFNNVPAPLFYVSPNQINAQVPFELPPGNVTVNIQSPSAPAVQQTITVAPAAPGIFTVNQTANGPGVILHTADFSLVSGTSPAHPGEFVAIFCTGLGVLKSVVPDGFAAPTPPARNRSRDRSAGGEYCSERNFFRPSSRICRPVSGQRPGPSELAYGTRRTLSSLQRRRGF